MAEPRRAALLGALVGMTLAGYGAGVVAGAAETPCPGATVAEAGVVCGPAEPLVSATTDVPAALAPPAETVAAAPAETVADVPAETPEPPAEMAASAPAETPEPSAETVADVPAETPEPPAETVASVPAETPEAAAKAVTKAVADVPAPPPSPPAAPATPPAAPAAPPAPTTTPRAGVAAEARETATPALPSPTTEAARTRAPVARDEHAEDVSAAREKTSPTLAALLAPPPRGRTPHRSAASATPRPAPDRRGPGAPTAPAPARTSSPLPATYVAGWDPAALLRAVAPGEAPPVPAYLLPIYVAAGAEAGVPWSVLAAINDVETDFGRNVAVSSAGATGWMQFMPATWRAYGQDGDGDGVEDPDNPVDAIFAAAAYLEASGAREDLGRAVFAYNHADWYVRDVLGRAAALEAVSPERLAAALEQGLAQTRELRRVTGGRGLLAPEPEGREHALGRRLLLPDDRLAKAVLDDGRIALYACGRADVRAGAIDRRVLVLLSVLADRGLRPSVSSLRCGHGRLTSSGNVSEHTTGTAVDIAAFAGQAVLGNQGRGSRIETAIRTVLETGGPQAAHQVISLMTVPGRPQAIAAGDHADHLHVGFRPLERAAPASP